MATYLDFEEKLKKVQDSILSAKLKHDEPAVEILEKELETLVKSLFSSLSPYQKLQLARHPDRPYALDYIKLILDNAYELHGDRHYSDDKSILAFLGYIGEHKFVVIGEQKGRGTKNKIYRNFGMPHPEGYRKALRVAKLAEKFGLPILFLVDTPGAYPGLGAEERNQSEAIARNLLEFSKLKVPTISVVIGEGGSGGALAIGVADTLAMMRYSVFSVISPEGCAAILWKDPSMVETATAALKITAEDLKELNLIDSVIEEPLIGAHREREQTAEVLKDFVISELEKLLELSTEELLENRYNRIASFGAFEEGEYKKLAEEVPKEEEILEAQKEEILEETPKEEETKDDK
jgi:acetyl-CoA carboxylase carboxyl transferase subunit alpha